MIIAYGWFALMHMYSLEVGRQQWAEICVRLYFALHISNYVTNSYMFPEMLSHLCGGGANNPSAWRKGSPLSNRKDMSHNVLQTPVFYPAEFGFRTVSRPLMLNVCN